MVGKSMFLWFSGAMLVFRRIDLAIKSAAYWPYCILLLVCKNICLFFQKFYSTLNKTWKIDPIFFQWGLNLQTSCWVGCFQWCLGIHRNLGSPGHLACPNICYKESRHSKWRLSGYPWDLWSKKMSCHHWTSETTFFKCLKKKHQLWGFKHWPIFVQVSKPKGRCATCAWMLLLFWKKTGSYMKSLVVYWSFTEVLQNDWK